jgi:transposase
MRTVERLPIRVIQERLQREYGLVISQGGIVGLLQRMAAAGQETYAQIQQEVRASRVVYADETGWRENGQHTTVWTVSTSQAVYVSHGRRTTEAIDGILGADFGGTIVADCYAAYDHFLGPKQRCWVPAPEA